MTENQKKSKSEELSNLHQEVSDLISDLPETKRNQLTSVFMQYEYSGTLPHPSIVQGYETVLPGSADRILRMSEINQSAEIEHQSKILKYQARDVVMGSAFSFATIIIALGLGAWLLTK